MLRSVGYDAASESLEAEFKDGAGWRYYGVPEFIYLQLINSDSLGRFMRDFIIDRYPDTKLHGKR
ncbi:MAG: KTSC domain-containing protein [Candidatus Chloroheliales bacterium]|nr:MAG: KTSC domain-containing protein [Chloroflexota bacterium]